MPPVIDLHPNGWAVRFDGTTECGAFIAAKMFPGDRPDQHWGHRYKGECSAWSNPNGDLLVARPLDFVIFYNGRYEVRTAIPAHYLDGMTVLTRNIMDEWMRR